MNPIAYTRPSDIDAAVAAIGDPIDSSTARGDARFIAGGTNLTDLMKLHIMQPATLVDINRLELSRIEASEDGGISLGALARNAETAYHPLVRERYPLLSSAILAGASPQIRNMATDGGNLLQRTRCYYFYDRATPCNKREPGSGCSAIGGLTRQHAILGASEHCIATHPSDMCVALAALEATVHVTSRRGSREIPFADFHRLPGDRPDLDNTLAQDELITRITLPEADRFAAHSAYLKIRDRLSYAFALVSVAAALDVDDAGRIREARLALGGVAHKPWRRAEAEALLAGAMPEADVFGRAADALLDGAVGQGVNDFKIPLARRAIVRALTVAQAGTVTNLRHDRDLPDEGGAR
ncbi:FAD-binding molybdopterin dehydrogenase [Lysobacteraceae bacterium NML93-0399]|nr:FAD-binding molybdopterin dehydrogenase [Xanthomonadaceae bacterium NML93-0399]